MYAQGAVRFYVYLRKVLSLHSFKCLKVDARERKANARSIISRRRRRKIEEP
jgi:hypothetical protein